MLLDLYATRTVPIAALAVQPETFGQSHTIKLAQGTLTITLPETPHEFASSEALTDDPQNPDHTWIGVGEVTLSAELDGRFDFSGTEDDFNSIKVLRSLDLVRSFAITETLLDDGLDLWKRTLRWVAVAPNIGIDELESAYSATRGMGFKLFRKQDGVLVRGHGGRATSHGLGKVSRDAWQSARKSFDMSEAPPVWFDFLHEAIRLITVGNNRGAVVSAAIAAETALRACFRANLPVIDDLLAVRVLDEVPAQKLLAKWTDIVGVSKAAARQQGASAVHELFDLRNSLMHEGLRDRAELARIEKLIGKVTSFTMAADSFVVGKAGMPQRMFPAPRVLERLTSNS